MDMSKIRTIIRQHADERGAKYRITKTGAVHYYGTMVNADKMGWYFVAWDASEWASEISARAVTRR